jgi:MerR family redox-sensitive transcriptional activator SoxR
MTIGTLAAQTGIPASTIRYWEKIALLPAPARVSGQRRYGPEALSRLALLQLASSCGFRLKEMHSLLHGFGAGVEPRRRWQELGRHKQTEIDAQIARLKAMRTIVDRVQQCHCVDLLACGSCARAIAEIRDTN